jgi:hypothetical protein
MVKCYHRSPIHPVPNIGCMIIDRPGHYYFDHVQMITTISATQLRMWAAKQQGQPPPVHCTNAMLFDFQSPAFRTAAICRRDDLHELHSDYGFSGRSSSSGVRRKAAFGAYRMRARMASLPRQPAAHKGTGRPFSSIGLFFKERAHQARPAVPHASQARSRDCRIGRGGSRTSDR